MSKSKKIVDLEIYIHILDRFGANARPALKLERIISDPEMMHDIALKALRREDFPAKIIIKKNIWEAASKFMQLGIIDKEELEKSYNAPA
jgi:hypothetical protein